MTVTVHCTEECPPVPHYHFHPVTLDDELTELLSEEGQ